MTRSDSAHDNWLAQRHLVNIAAAAVVAFYLHSLAIIMSSNSQAPSTISGSQWTDLEIETILQFFIIHRSEIGDAGNFKKSTYTAAAGIIPGRTRSPSQVQSKWQSVSKIYYHFRTSSHIS